MLFLMDIWSSFFQLMFQDAEFEPLFWIPFVLQTLEQQLAALKTEMEQLRQEKVSEEQSSSAAQLQGLQAQLVTHTHKSLSTETFTESKYLLISPVG